MSAVVLARLRELFLAPADAQAPATQVAERAVPATFAVLASGTEAAVAGAALGLAAARARRAPCAVVCVWSAAPGLSTRGLEAAARGRLVTVALPVAGAEARAAAERALAAAGEAPVTLVVAGPRPAALDGLLAAVDRVVVVPAPDAPAGLEDLAVDAAARLGRSTAVLRLPAAGSALGRALAAAGLLLVGALRAAVAETLDGGRG
jgi:hypothetical protein